MNIDRYDRYGEEKDGVSKDDGGVFYHDMFDDGRTQTNLTQSYRFRINT